MDLSWEALWQNHRRQLEDDVAAIHNRAGDLLEEGNTTAAERLYNRRDGIGHALSLMDEAERHRGPNA